MLWAGTVSAYDCHEDPYGQRMKSKYVVRGVVQEVLEETEAVNKYRVHRQEVVSGEGVPEEFEVHMLRGKYIFYSEDFYVQQLTAGGTYYFTSYSFDGDAPMQYRSADECGGSVFAVGAQAIWQIPQSEVKTEDSSMIWKSADWLGWVLLFLVLGGVWGWQIKRRGE